jgi:acetoin utilization deacetylase AcuC-like enzyme
MKGWSALWRRRRKLAGVFRRPAAQLVYSRLYQLDLPGAAYDPLRGERILAFLESAGLLPSRALHAALPASFRDLRRVHTDDYLDTLNRAETYLPILGQEISDEQAERVLETQRTMAGGTLLAAALALQSRGVAVNLGGGLHHAFAAKGERFCMLNDVAVAIAELRARGTPGPVLVVDLDLHDGDGTRSIFADDPTVHTFSIHNLSTPDERGLHAAASTSVELPGEVGDAEYLAAVRRHLPPVFAAFRPEIVFYVAGCDPAVDDRIGNWKISAAGMLERDLFVLSCARGGGRPGSHRNQWRNQWRNQRRNQRPLVIVLGGGYGRGAWRYTARFLSAVRGQAVEPPGSEESLLQRYRRMARGIAPHELTGDTPGDDWGLTADDIAAVLGGLRRPYRLLGYYTRQGLELAFERTGLFDRLRSRGFDDPSLDLELGGPEGDTVRLYGDRGHRELLMEVRLRIDRHTVPGLALLRIEWLLLQNPRASFTPQRPALPGQRHPGLGMLQDILALLVLACDRLQLDGLLFVHSHFHTVAQGKSLRFLSPEDDGLLRSVRAALDGLPLIDASRAVAEGRVVDARTGRPFQWTPRPMVLAVTDRLREKIEGEEYERRAGEAAAQHSFVLRR